jgi:elongation factor Ts
MGNDIAMQIAAMNPIAICQEDVPNNVLEKEREIIKEQITDAKNPEIVQKMVEGRIKKFYKENVLLEQQFIKNDKIQIKDYLTKFGAKVSSYKRITI